MLAILLFLGLVLAQPSPLESLSSSRLGEPSGAPDLENRVPLFTEDRVPAPLLDLQVFAPPVVPQGGTSCVVELLKHAFGNGSYNAPAVVRYVPPTAPNCGSIGKWATVALNLSVYSIGTQYDRLGSIYLSHTEIWRTSSAEPTKTGIVWNTVKDVTHFTPLFATEGDLMMDLGNIISPALMLDGVLHAILTATFYAPTENFPTPITADHIIPLSNLSPTLPNYFSIENDTGAITNISLPNTAVEAFVEIFCSGNAAEEFWYSNTPDEFLSYFPASTGLIGKGPSREVQLFVDDQLAGVVWPYAVIYTGGITPSDWRPLAAYGAYDAPTYWIDITPFLPSLLSPSAHTITLRVLGQGTKPTINPNWFVSGSIHVRTGNTTTTGKLKKYEAPPLRATTSGGASAGNETVWTTVSVSRELVIESDIITSDGVKTVRFSQSLEYINKARYADDGWIQWVNQTTSGTISSTHQGTSLLQDTFSYPLNIFSNYSLYTAEFGEQLQR